MVTCQRSRELLLSSQFFMKGLGFRVLNPQPLTIYVQCTLGISCSNKSYKKAIRWELTCGTRRRRSLGADSKAGLAFFTSTWSGESTSKVTLLTLTTCNEQKKSRIVIYGFCCHVQIHVTCTFIIKLPLHKFLQILWSDGMSCNWVKQTLQNLTTSGVIYAAGSVIS